MKDSRKYYIIVAIIIVVALLLLRFCNNSKRELAPLPHISAHLESGSLTSSVIHIETDSIALSTDRTTEYGVCWSTKAIPQISDSSKRVLASNRVLSVNLSSYLQPGTKYNVRAYVKNKRGIVYSDVFPLLAPKPLEVITNIDNRKIPLNSESIVIDNAKEDYQLVDSKIEFSNTYQNQTSFELKFDPKIAKDVIERGVCYSETNHPTVAFNVVSDKGGSGDFVGVIPNLTPNKMYYCRPYVITAKDTLYGKTQVIITPKIDVPLVAEMKASRVGASSMEVMVDVVTDGGSEAIERGICWSLENNPTIDDSHIIDSLATGTGRSGAKITGLTLNTPYFLRAYASNGVGVGYGPISKIYTAIGDIGADYAGGIIFYLDETGRHGGVCAPSDQSSGIHWIGAVLLCKQLQLNGYSDWLLPSKEELDLIYTNLYLNNIGNLSNYYWSSTENDYNDAWYWRMNYGSPYYNFKGNVLSVRAVRHF